MNKIEETYRGVNKYIDYTTSQEYIEYSEPSSKIGVAKMRATRLRHPNGKTRPTKKIGNQYIMVQTQGYGGRMFDSKQFTTHFEFLETWAERVKEWEKV